MPHDFQRHWYFQAVVGWMDCQGEWIGLVQRWKCLCQVSSLSSLSFFFDESFLGIQFWHKLIPPQHDDDEWWWRGKYFEKKFPSWKQGDVLGMLVCLSGREAVVYFYKNSEQVPHRLAIKKPQNEILYPYCLLGKGEEVRFIYRGKKGLHSILNHSVLKLEIKES